MEELRHGRSPTDEITKSATKHGRRLWLDGFTIGQVVHGYGDELNAIDVNELVESHVGHAKVYVRRDDGAVQKGTSRPDDRRRAVYWRKRE